MGCDDAGSDKEVYNHNVRFFAVIFMGLIITGCSTTGLTHGVPAVVCIDPVKKIYRCGLPTSKEGWDYVFGLGVRTVVKRSTYEELSDADARQVKQGEQYAESLGIKIIRYPISTKEQFLGQVKMADMRAAVAAITNNVQVSCLHGRDRTGLTVGCWRVWVCGWSKEQAWKEMIANGFRPELIGLTEFWITEVKEPR